MEECAATRHALLSAHDRGWRLDIVESNPLSLMSILQNGHKRKAPIDLFLDDIRSLVSFFESLLSSNVRIVGNAVEHLLTRLPKGGGQ